MARQSKAQLEAMKAIRGATDRSVKWLIMTNLCKKLPRAVPLLAWAKGASFAPASPVPARNIVVQDGNKHGVVACFSLLVFVFCGSGIFCLCFLAQLQMPLSGQADSGMAFGIFLNPWKGQKWSFSLVQKHTQGDKLRNLCKK